MTLIEARRKACSCGRFALSLIPGKVDLIQEVIEQTTKAIAENRCQIRSQLLLKLVKDFPDVLYRFGLKRQPRRQVATERQIVLYKFEQTRTFCATV